MSKTYKVTVVREVAVTIRVRADSVDDAVFLAERAAAARVVAMCDRRKRAQPGQLVCVSTPEVIRESTRSKTAEHQRLVELRKARRKETRHPRRAGRPARAAPGGQVPTLQ